MFRKPMSEEQLEREENNLKQFRNQKFDKKEEWALIWAALKTLLPGVLLVLAIFGLLVWGIATLWLG